MPKGLEYSLNVVPISKFLSNTLVFSILISIGAITASAPLLIMTNCNLGKQWMESLNQIKKHCISYNLKKSISCIVLSLFGKPANNVWSIIYIYNSMWNCLLLLEIKQMNQFYLFCHNRNLSRCFAPVTSLIIYAAAGIWDMLNICE